MVITLVWVGSLSSVTNTLSDLRVWHVVCSSIARPVRALILIVSEPLFTLSIGARLCLEVVMRHFHPFLCPVTCTDGSGDIDGDDPVLVIACLIIVVCLAHVVVRLTSSSISFVAVRVSRVICRVFKMWRRSGGIQDVSVCAQVVDGIHDVLDVRP